MRERIRLTACVGVFGCNINRLNPLFWSIHFAEIDHVIATVLTHAPSKWGFVAEQNLGLLPVGLLGIMEWMIEWVQPARSRLTQGAVWRKEQSDAGCRLQESSYTLYVLIYDSTVRVVEWFCLPLSPSWLRSRRGVWIVTYGSFNH